MATQKRILAEEAALAGFDDCVAAVERGDLGLDAGSRGGGLGHFSLEGVNGVRIGLQGRRDFGLEGVNGGEVREERNEVFNFEELAAVEEVNCAEMIVLVYYIADGDDRM